MSQTDSEPDSELSRDADWRRLDARMLLVHPVNELIRFLPVIIGIFVLGSSGGDDGGPWHYIGVALPIAIGLLRFASTKFRITPGQIELHRGILGRNVLTAPLDRVRTVELTATPIHRILGLEKVEVGTGSGSKSGDSRLVLDSLGRAEAQRLRGELLHATPETEAVTGVDLAQPGSSVILRLDPAWVRYAPLTSSGVLIALGAVGAVGGPLSGSNLIADIADSDAVGSLADVAVPLLVISALVGFAIVSAVLASAGYLLGNWGFTLTRDDRSRTYHVRRGALTTRETTIDQDRLRGLEIHEPLGLRLAGAGRLNAIVTGLDRRARGSSPIVPPAPRPVVVGVGEHVLEEDGPFHVDLVQHGPEAFRRRIVRAVVPLALVPAVLGILAGVADAPVWLVLVTLPLPVVGLALALDRYARLGHALTPAYVVVRWGSLRGRRDALQRTGIIGWNVRQSVFQRRAGLVSLSATTAAGQQSYEMLDVPEGTAIALADEAVPGLVSQFLR